MVNEFFGLKNNDFLSNFIFHQESKNIMIRDRPLAGYGLPPLRGNLKTIFFMKPNVLQGFCNILAL